MQNLENYMMKMNSSNNDNMKYYIAGGVAAVFLIILIVVLSSSSSENWEHGDHENLKNGEKCRLDSECESNNCDGNMAGTTEGECKPKSPEDQQMQVQRQQVRKGGRCAVDSECIKGLVCKGNIPGITEGKCRPKK